RREPLPGRARASDDGRQSAGQHAGVVEGRRPFLRSAAERLRGERGIRWRVPRRGLCPRARSRRRQTRFLAGEGLTLRVTAAIYAVAVAAALLCLLRWEIRRVRRSSRRKSGRDRAQRALAGWLAGLMSDREKKSSRRDAA